MSEAVLERFHRALIEEIQTQRPEYLTSAFTVAEIYQNLVPYGSHRDRIGVAMNGDYEAALIRLLAGEGGYLILDSEPALKNLQAELKTSNPNTGLYREFAAADVRLNQAHLDLSAAAMGQLPDLATELDAEDPIAMNDLALAGGVATGPDLGIVPPGVDIFADPIEVVLENPVLPVAATPDPPVTQAVASAPDSSAHRQPLVPELCGEAAATPTMGEERSVPPTATTHSATTDGAACQWCRADLPNPGSLNYCPFCGTDLRLVACGSCRAELEPGWRFCASCGFEASG
jgi:predicted RNA-binding Zn-ribbon protein involved in translation (DUF1610 family)